MRDIRKDIETFLSNIENEVLTEKTLDIEEIYMLMTRAAMEIDRLRKVNTNQSWQINPDRSGGQFTQEEIDQANRNNW